MSKVKRLGVNIKFRALNYAVAIVAGFFLFPFMVKHVGNEVYGVYIMVISVTGYLGMLDLGVMSALTKYVSEYNGTGNTGRINNVIAASFTFYSVVAVIISICLMICARYFTLFFKVGPSSEHIVKMLFTVAAASSLFVWPLSAFRGAAQGLSLWDVDAMTNMSVQVLNALSAFVILKAGYGIVPVFIVSQLLTISGSIFLYRAGKKKIDIKIKFPFFDAETFKTIFNFSLFVFLSSLVYIFMFQVHNIIIGYFVSVSAITVYAVAYNLQSYFRGLNSTLGAPPWTIASEMHGRKDEEAQRQLLFKGTKYMSAVFVPAVFIVMFFAGPFINYWMGADFAASVLPAKIVILFWVFNGTVEIATGMLSARGIIRRPLYIHAASAAVNLLISLSLVKRLGITAIALGLTVSMMAVSAPLLLRLSLKSLGVKFSEYYNNSIRPNIVLYAFVTALSAAALKFAYPQNLPVTLIEMCAIYAAGGLIYYSFMLSGSEKHELLKLAGLENIKMVKA